MKIQWRTIFHIDVGSLLASFSKGTAADLDYRTTNQKRRRIGIEGGSNAASFW
jgi:hypothetical protein